MSCALYRHFDASDNLLYVGISLHPINRLDQHRKISPWAGDIVRVEIQHLETREIALEAEWDAIQNEKPKHNIQKTKSRKPTRGEELVEESHVELLEQVTVFQPMYTLAEAGYALSIGPTQIKRMVQDKEIGHVVIGMRGEHEVKRITGWQIIEYIEHLQNER
jgi:predicted GIY-YIG superfamily endonuclease